MVLLLWYCGEALGLGFDQKGLSQRVFPFCSCNLLEPDLPKVFVVLQCGLAVQCGRAVAIVGEIARKQRYFSSVLVKPWGK